MKQQLTLQEMAAEVSAIAATKRDFVAGDKAIRFEPEGADLMLQLPWRDDSKPGLSARVDRFAAGQMAEVYQVPRAYALRLLDSDDPEDVGLLAQNLNHWTERGTSGRMIRTINDTETGAPVARAFLSDRYRPLDNVDLMSAILPTFSDLNLTVQSTGFSPTKMHIKATSDRLEGEVAKGDVVQMGIAISNSEVGDGAVNIQPLIYRLVCLNGMISGQALRQFHIGKGAEDMHDSFVGMLKPETRAAQDKAFWLKVRDVVRGVFTEQVFGEHLNRIREVANQPIPGEAAKVVEVVTETMGLPDTTGAAILQHLIEGGDLSRWGLVNAVTATANDAETYELATSLEQAGGKIIELPRRNWETIANAA